MSKKNAGPTYYEVSDALKKLYLAVASGWFTYPEDTVEFKTAQNILAQTKDILERQRKTRSATND